MDPVNDKVLIADEQVQVPVIITHKRKSCDIYIPDFEITVHGKDYVDTLASAIMTTSAVYYYNLERNLKMSLTTRFEDAEKLCTHASSFVSFIGLVS